VGPIKHLVREVNQNYTYFDLPLMVNGSQLEKKHLSLNEPSSINLHDRSRPLELVATRIDKNQVQGYSPSQSTPTFNRGRAGVSKPELSHASAGLCNAVDLERLRHLSIPALNSVSILSRFHCPFPYKRSSTKYKL
jgi:hypothetical protein